MKSYEVTWLDHDQKTRVSVIDTDYPDLLAFKMHDQYGNKFSKIKILKELGRKEAPCLCRDRRPQNIDYQMGTTERNRTQGRV